MPTSHLILPEPLRKGDTIGIVSPSSAGHLMLREKYQRGLAHLRHLGFQVREAPSLSLDHPVGPRERAADLQTLWQDPNVKAIVSTIGGLTSGSLLPYLDFEQMERHSKFLCGFSDITALHCGIASQTRLPSLYGPAVIAGFGEAPEPPEYSLNGFFRQTGFLLTSFPHRWEPPRYWTREFVDAEQPGWDQQVKTFQPNDGWKCLRPGTGEAPIMALNQNTLVSLAGTPYFPDLRGKILFMEQVTVHPGLDERQLNQLRMMGVFRGLKGLVIGKPEKIYKGYDLDTYDQMILDFADVPNGCPIVAEFDAGHTIPILTMPQRIPFRVEARPDQVDVIQLSPAYRTE